MLSQQGWSTSPRTGILGHERERKRKKEKKTISPPIWKPNRPSHAPRCTAEIRAPPARARLEAPARHPRAHPLSHPRSRHALAVIQSSPLPPPRCCSSRRRGTAAVVLQETTTVCAEIGLACAPPSLSPRRRACVKTTTYPAGARRQVSTRFLAGHDESLLTVCLARGGEEKKKKKKINIVAPPPSPLLVRIGDPEGSRVTLVLPRIHTHGAGRTRTGGAWAREGKMGIPDGARTNERTMHKL